MESEVDKKINGAVVALKSDIDSFLKRVDGDNERILKENFENAQAIKALREEFNIHVRSPLHIKQIGGNLNGTRN